MGVGGVGDAGVSHPGLGGVSDLMIVRQSKDGS